MTIEEAKKRKACQSCTKAKAKCSPFEDRLDVCYRCQRLKKECVFDDTVKKRGPKNRSRVKQLEQRVDTLIDLLANGQAVNVGATPKTDAGLGSATTDERVPIITPPESATDSERCCPTGETWLPCDDSLVQTYKLPNAPGETFITFDPVEVGLLDDRRADALLQQYKDHCASVFPFVMIPQSINAKALRQSQPFLFHAILTVTAHGHPGLQLTLSAQFKEQISSRIIKHSHKSLELLQGLLVFTAWYHFYYDPRRQQLATMLQLCIAMMQDLNLCKNSQESKRMFTRGRYCGSLYSTRLLAEKRAFLGTFYLTASFSQAWRKRTTLSHTRYMDQCCQSLTDCQEYPTDTLIMPLVQLSALMCRVNDFYSYNDIENAEINGESMLQLSTNNFESELARLKDSIAPSLIENNPTLQLSIRLIDIWIHENAVHGSLWKRSGEFSTSFITSSRLKVLCRCLNAVQSYLSNINAVPTESIEHLAFPSWSSFCYTCIIACKLVFLGDEREQDTEVPETFAEILNLVTDKSLYMEPMPSVLPVEIVSSAWDPVAVAKEADLISLFNQMYDKMKYTLPKDQDAEKHDHCNINPLSRIAFLQRSVLCSFTNRLNEYITKLVQSNRTADSTEESNAIVRREDWTAPQTNMIRERYDRARGPLLQNLNFNSINFDSIAPPENSMPVDGPFSDWLWNTAMDDFTMPPL